MKNLEEIDWGSFGAERSLLKETIEELRSDMPRYILLFLALGITAYLLYSKLFTLALQADLNKDVISLADECRAQAISNGGGQYLIPQVCNTPIGKVVLVHYSVPLNLIDNLFPNPKCEYMPCKTPPCNLSC